MRRKRFIENVKNRRMAFGNMIEHFGAWKTGK
jgi:hypothetical protein